MHGNYGAYFSTFVGLSKLHKLDTQIHTDYEKAPTDNTNLPHPLASLVTLEGGGPFEVSASTTASSTASSTAASGSADDTPSHLVGSLAPFLGEDDLDLAALHDEAVHLLASIEGLLMGGELDEGEALGLLGVKVAGDVDIADVTDAAEGLVDVGRGDVVGNVANEEGKAGRALIASSAAASSTTTATRWGATVA